MYVVILTILDLKSGKGCNLYDLSGYELLSQKQITHLPCNRLICGVCELPDEHILFMKGICQDYIDLIYDVQYHVSGVKNNQPYFK